MTEPFNTLQMTDDLKAGGFTDQQARALTAALVLAVAPLATKADLDALSAATRADLDALRVATKADLDALRVATKADINALRVELKHDIDLVTIRLGGVVVTCITVASVLGHFWH